LDSIHSLTNQDKKSQSTIIQSSTWTKKWSAKKYWERSQSTIIQSSTWTCACCNGCACCSLSQRLFKAALGRKTGCISITRTGLSQRLFKAALGQGAVRLGCNIDASQSTIIQSSTWTGERGYYVIDPTVSVNDYSKQHLDVRNVP